VTEEKNKEQEALEDIGRYVTEVLRERKARSEAEPVEGEPEKGNAEDNPE
jgi:hypothetical protein